jgi:hypothetical protein
VIFVFAGQLLISSCNWLVIEPSEAFFSSIRRRWQALEEVFHDDIKGSTVGGAGGVLWKIAQRS